MVPHSSFLQFLILFFFFLQELKKEMNLDPTFLDYRHRIQDTPEAYPDCVIHQEIILQKGHLWLPKDSPIIHTIITEFHNTPTRGHMGVAKTMERVGENFIWPSMRKDIKLFVSVCLVCQQTKNDHRKSTRLLCLLPVPARPWEDLSLDFIVGLPPYQGHTTILVIVDRFSKGVHLGLLLTHYTAFRVARVFMEVSGKLHGPP